MNTLTRILLSLLVAGIGFGYRSAKIRSDKTFLGIHEDFYIIAAILLGVVLFGWHFMIYRKHKSLESIGYDSLPILFLAITAFLWLSILIILNAAKESSVLLIIGGAAVMAYAFLLLFAAWRHIRSK